VKEHIIFIKDRKTNNVNHCAEGTNANVGDSSVAGNEGLQAAAYHNRDGDLHADAGEHHYPDVTTVTEYENRYILSYKTVTVHRPRETHDRFVSLEYMS
jgi:hypothetical protein